MICHRRAGKTVSAINELIKQAAICTKVQPRFAFMAPTRVRAKDIAWEYLKRFAKPSPDLRVNESELFVEHKHNEGRITLYGADNDRGMGLYLDGIVFDECDEIPPSTYDVVLPALSDRKGWAMWMGILRGRHNLWKRYEKMKNEPDTFSMLLRASESGILDDEEMGILKRQLNEVSYALQMEIDTNASIENAIYGKQMDTMRRTNRLRLFSPDLSVPAYSFWDIGHSDQGDFIAIWLVQFIGRDIMLLDFICRTGEVPAFYAAKVREWEAKHRVQVICDYLPHDGARRNQVGKTYLNYLRDAGRTTIKTVPRTPALWDGINVGRNLLSQVYVHSVHCAVTWTLNSIEMPSGIDSLDYYRKKEDASTGIIQDIPIHDQYSHGADAFRTMAEAYNLGMIEGTSFVARDSARSNPPRSQGKMLAGMTAPQLPGATPNRRVA